LFERFNGWLPLQRLSASNRFLVVAHPRPAYQFHGLLIPKQAIPGLQTIRAGDSDQARLLLEALTAASQIARDNGLQNYQIIVNGGAFQDIPQLHFHLISNEPPVPNSS